MELVAALVNNECLQQGVQILRAAHLFSDQAPLVQLLAYLVHVEVVQEKL